MKEIKSTTFKLTSKDADKLNTLPTYKANKLSDKGKDKDKILSLTKKECPGKERFWRLIYKADSKEIVSMFEAEGVTSTSWDMFCGTKEECLAEVERLDLNIK